MHFSSNGMPNSRTVYRVFQVYSSELKLLLLKSILFLAGAFSLRHIKTCLLGFPRLWDFVCKNKMFFFLNIHVFLMFSTQKKQFSSLKVPLRKFLAPNHFKHFALFQPRAGRRLWPLPVCSFFVNSPMFSFFVTNQAL